MKKLLEKSRYTVILAVMSTLLGAILLFIHATISMIGTAIHMFKALVTNETYHVAAHMVGILDVFLLAVILYIFAIGLYELFIGDLDMPGWLNITDLDDLKKKLSSVIALMLAVIFLEHLSEWKDPQGTLYFAIAISIVIFSLVFYMKSKGNDKK